MSKTKKTSYKAFDYMHCDDFARYLEDMAEKGWHFKEWGAGLKFEKGEPQNVTYAVEVFTGASEYDLRPEPNTQEFAEYCEAAGWKFIDGKQKFCIFKKIREDATPILTSEERVNNITKEMRGVVWTNLIIYLAMVIMSWTDMFGELRFQYNIFSSTNLYFLFFWTVLFVFHFQQWCKYVIWKRNCKYKLNIGEEVYIGNSKGKSSLSENWFRWMVLLIAFFFLWNMNLKYAAVFLLGFVVITMVGFTVVMNKIRPDSATNALAQVAFYMFLFISLLVFSITMNEKENDKESQITPPLVISDYREFDEMIEEVTLYQEQNLFGNMQIYFIWYEEECLSYQVYKSEHNWILDRIWEDEVGAEFNIKGTDYVKEWEAELAFRNKIGEYYVRYEDVLFIFSEDKDIVLDSEQINIIRDKLKLR